MNSVLGNGASKAIKIADAVDDAFGDLLSTTDAQNSASEAEKLICPNSSDVQPTTTTIIGADGTEQQVDVLKAPSNRSSDTFASKKDVKFGAIAHSRQN